jgi:hypothetical protein
MLVSCETQVRYAFCTCSLFILIFIYHMYLSPITTYTLTMHYIPPHHALHTPSPFTMYTLTIHHVHPHRSPHTPSPFTMYTLTIHHVHPHHSLRTTLTNHPMYPSPLTYTPSYHSPKMFHTLHSATRLLDVYIAGTISTCI